MATLSINIKRMKEWYKEKKILQKTNINLKTENPKSKTENSEDQDDSASLLTIGHFGNFAEIKYSSKVTYERMESKRNLTFRGSTFNFPRSTGQLSAERSEARQF